MKQTTVPESVLKVIRSSASAHDGGLLTIDSPLSSKDYKAVNAALEALGGKWNRGKKAHVFAGKSKAEVCELLANVLATGSVTTAADLGWFPTPAELADSLASMIPTENLGLVLEPSAGEGALVRAILRRNPSSRILAVEVHEARAKTLASIGPGVEVTPGDFLGIAPSGCARFDAVLMNPPFAPARADIKHVKHALKFLRPGGTLVAVMSRGVDFRADKVTEDFRGGILAMGGTIEPLPSDSFRQSGTRVETSVIRVAAV